MKFVMLFVAVLVAAAIASVPSNGVPSISFACSKPGDIMTGHTVSWTPKDVKSGETLHITATGTLSAPVTRGAEVHVAAKLDGIPILTKTMDLCDLCMFCRAPLFLLFSSDQDQRNLPNPSWQAVHCRAS
eukprot:NODE_1546_length_913_cov_504.878472_g1200_i0.p1 GENE.NODE_1546_length_913_cov_504.878472_g1200_i0~~NODE_1546_length_913_cov_504.878472_g1200_i0.p1  ORF type:complete len:147 (+),score=50.34 NODE_1546_length_913_cov_504.878472_g1200_i0:52-441(+)